MAAAQRERSGRRPTRGAIIGAVAGVAAVATVVTLAVTANGYEAQQVPRLETSVWVSRDAGQYARVNTDLAEIDVVRDVDDPSAIVQSGSRASVYSQGLGQRWPVNVADPVDLVGDEGVGGTPTPVGTREVQSAGDWIAYRTDTGTVHVGRIESEQPVPVDPFAGEEQGAGDDETYAANAIGISPDGQLVMYSAREGAVRGYDAEGGRFTDPTPIESPPAADAGVQLAVVGEHWLLVDAADGRVWVDGGAPEQLDVGADALLQQSAASGDTAYVADAEGLLSIPLDGADPERVASDAGTPARPVVAGSTVVAAWLAPDGGSAWFSDTGESVALAMPAGETDASASLSPVLRTNGDRAVLNETAGGLLWTLPDGRLVPLEQWNLDDEVEDKVGTQQVEDLARQEPPVAVADSFGVRAGQQVELPVLLNDHDPNSKDVLTVDRASMAGGLADPGFGELSLVANDQTPTVRVRATSGSTTFSYAVTDGQASSAPVTVTLTVVPDDQNSAPVWCGVEGCVQQWPSPQLMPGGTAIVDVLSGWVDPEGDAFVLAGAEPLDPAAPVTVVPMGNGRVAIRHTDPNAAGTSVPVKITVADVHGASAEATLDVRVTSSAALDVSPVAVTAGAGRTAIVSIADHASGGSGSLRLLDAVPTASAEGAGLEVVPNAAAGQVELRAAEPGAYTATFTVQDLVTRAEQAATIRVTVAPPGAPIAIAPMTAFVRQGEDTMVDVLGAVQNTGGRVLMVTDAVSVSPELNIGLVGQSQVRVAGATRDGQPGLVGRARVTVSDGAGGTAVGDLSVFLVARTAGLSPIAMPDTVTMRAGELVSIPVTANDVSPRAERLVVHPEVTGSGTAGELVFASGSSIRYLAPKTPGTYELGYAVGLEQAPDRLDHSTVTVTVLPDGANRAPQPRSLVARVLSGQSVSIPVPAAGMDPDGDRTVLTSVTQPGKGLGVATISAEGDAIVYTAPADGTGDTQPSFEYTVRDASGATGSAAVRVGVLTAAVTDAAPVTFSDYVRVQRSSDSPVTVDPAGNDLDPAQGALRLVKLVPNAPEGTPEYQRLLALIDDQTSLGDRRVVLRAGDVVGTNSYRYTVASERTSSTAEGLIVVNVTESASTEVPVVNDTVVTARTRLDLEQRGLDVVSGRVVWASGDARTLKLELWGKAAASAGYTVEGQRIRGPLPKDGALVPFRLSGENTAGGEVEAFGFLIVPAADELRVQLRGDVSPVEVKEEGSKTFDVAKLLDLASGDAVEVAGDGEFPVQRKAASCTPAGGTNVEYRAGAGAPWSDLCLVGVRLPGQRAWSQVAVPVAVIPKDPQAILSAVSRTVAPGASETVRLYDEMTSWEGGREGDRSKLDYAVTYQGSAFTVTQQGSKVTAEARADARPGTRETVTIGVSAFGGLTSAITLVVGQAPADQPRGAVFTKQCSVDQGSSCSIPVVGVSGEYDPFAGKTGSGLKLRSIGSTSCPVAGIGMQGDTAITVTWPSGQNAYGGECVVPFTVVDAQGRTGEGRVTVDLLGLPQAPASIATADYTKNSVTMEVSLGEALRAHPAVTGVEILEGGRSVGADCRPGAPGVWLCVVGGLVPGERHSYSARAVNGVGASAATSSVEAWAYEAPTVDGVVATPVYRPGTTSQGTGVVQLTITADADARSFRVQETGQTIDRTGKQTTADLTLAPGPQTITLVPISVYTPPTGRGNNEGGQTATPVTVAGAPFFDPNGIAATATTNSSIRISGVGLQQNHSAKAAEMVYFAWRSGSEPQCSADGSGALTYSSGSAKVSSSPDIDGLDERKRYYIKACGSNGFGVVASGVGEVRVYTSADTPTGEASYTVATSPAQSGRHYRYEATGPSLAAIEDFHVEYRSNSSNWTSDFGAAVNDWSNPGQVFARQCHNTWGGLYCSNEIQVTANTAPAPVSVDFSGSCVAIPPNESNVSLAEAGVTVTNAGAGSAVLRSWSRDAANSPTKATVVVGFDGAYGDLADISREIDVCPAPDPPDPEPDPDPTVPDPGTGG
ncbi:Ig-like domain-containing protein [Agromyces sp. NPDC060279]|uniref:Ig-like domain-containing protein n=1 Tax=Agromyces sp. NPDC060279 TaxID=3347092 RepID=UPI00364C3BB4